MIDRELWRAVCRTLDDVERAESEDEAIELTYQLARILRNDYFASAVRGEIDSFFANSAGQQWSGDGAERTAATVLVVLGLLRRIALADSQANEFTWRRAA